MSQRSSEFNPLGEEVASAERYALMQRVEVYPAALRREVVRQSLHGLSDATIATLMRIPVSDVHAIMEAFKEVSEEQAI